MRDTAVKGEAISIQAYPSHPCHSFLPAQVDNQYNLKINNKSSRYKFSGTERHKQSFITRACKYFLSDCKYFLSDNLEIVMFLSNLGSYNLKDFYLLIYLFTY